ncbi:PKD domain-containing protein, partial [Ruegeria atlantica]|uniref:PKD domain-containing protein n=1 Tax=Ruegeria atlantica TaxID=81569 RepID=UPI001C2C1837
MRVTATENDAPIADAGADQSVQSGAEVTLDGTGSYDPLGGRITNYRWERTGGTGSGSVALSGASTATPSFTADVLQPADDPVTHEFSLVVTDNDGAESVADTVTITVEILSVTRPAPEILVVSLESGVVEDLDVFEVGELPIGEPYTVNYIVQNTGNAPLILGDPHLNFDMDLVSASIGGFERTIEPGVSINIEVTLIPMTTNLFTFHLSFPTNDEDEDFFSIGLTARGVDVNIVAPIADAGVDQTVASGAVVTLDGTGSSDSDGTITGYRWELVDSGGGILNVFEATSAQPTFTADPLRAFDSPVTYEFSLVVTDNDGAESEADTVRVTVTPPENAAPVSDAGVDQTVVSGAVVTLDGTGSTDSDGTITDYTWIRTGGSGTFDMLTNPTSAMPTFTADALQPGDNPVTHEFGLLVTDDQGATSAPDRVTITVVPAAEEIRQFEISGFSASRLVEGSIVRANVNLIGPRFPAGTPEEDRTLTLEIDQLSSNSATASDVVSQDLTFVFPVAEEDTSFNFSTVDDDIPEELEVLTLRLGSSRTSIEIVDNEPYDISFSPSQTSLREGEEQTVNVILDRVFHALNPQSFLSLRFQFEADLGDATINDLQNEDIVFMGGSPQIGVDFNDGEQEQSFTIEALNDQRREGRETAVVRLNPILGDADLISVDSLSTQLNIEISDSVLDNVVPVSDAGVDQTVVSGAVVT